MTSNALVFYDCEATCIGGLPIEIGWAFQDTSTNEIKSESHLIRPPSHWDMKPVWDPDAQKLHKIPMWRLSVDGRSVSEIAQRMNEVLAGRELCSDGPNDDARWLQIIFEEAGLTPTFTVTKINAKELLSQLAIKAGLDKAAYEAANDEAERIAPTTHRAEADARHWATLHHLISCKAPSAK